jgi:hypothetical protein
MVFRICCGRRNGNISDHLQSLHAIVAVLSAVWVGRWQLADVMAPRALFSHLFRACVESASPARKQHARRTTHGQYSMTKTTEQIMLSHMHLVYYRYSSYPVRTVETTTGSRESREKSLAACLSLRERA